MAELALAIGVGRWIGALPTIGLLLATLVAGAVLVRTQGSAAFRSVRTAVRAGRLPPPDVAARTALVVAGLLLMVPGFITDLAAVLVLFPPTRAVLRRPLDRWFRRAAADRALLVQRYGPGLRPGPAGGPPASAPRFGADVVEGEIIDDDPVR